MSGLLKRQLAATRKELERAQVKEARERLASLKLELTAARKRRSERMRQVGAECRANRQRISARARAARARLNDAIARQRSQASESCSTSRGEARSIYGAEVDRAFEALELERGSQRQLAAWTRKAPSSAATARERRQESDDEVRANIEDAALLPVFDRVKSKIKGSARKSRTEAFAEWVASHAAEVYEIQHAALEQEIEALEREEYSIRRALAKRQPKRQRSRLDAVPF